jgi:uncharacterized protein (TIGR03118 family)
MRYPFAGVLGLEAAALENKNTKMRVEEKMKRKIASRFCSFFLAGFLLAAASASAQSIAYRQTNLSSDVNTQGFANQLNLSMINSWGIAFLPGQPFFIVNPDNGRVTVHDANGTGVAPSGFAVPSPVAGHDSPIGIVADPNSHFGGRNLVQPFLMATREGDIYFWGPDANGNVLTEATLALDHQLAGAVYTGLAILTPDCCGPFLAVANFHSGLIETYNIGFNPLAPPGSFTDPNLPPGYAPFGMQVIGNQLFVTYAVQDAAKQNPVFGAGNGIVSIFDLAGNFVRRFATGGPLNAPWGVTQASANFGPFSGEILIGNVGDGIINAFAIPSGNFSDQIKDGNGNAIVNAGLHGLTFRSDGFGDPNTLYFTAGINDGHDGLFGALTAGLVSTTRVSVPTTPSNTAAPITVTVSAGPGNSGTPKGMATIQDGGVPLSDVAITNGSLLFNTVLRRVGTHVIGAQYEGDDTFLPSFAQTEVQITGPATTLTLAAPANAAPGSPVTMTATINSSQGTPTGQIVFHDGNTDLGNTPLNANGIATLTINTLAAGAHSLTASYAGDGNFEASTSLQITTTIAARDFSLGAAPLAATVTAGQSTSFNVTVTATGGFVDPVTFSCPVLTGITCTFNPPMVTPNGAPIGTMLTVTTSAGVTRYGHVLGITGSGFLLASLGLIGILALLKETTRKPHAAFLRVAAGALTVITLALTLVSCGGYTTSGQTNRGTAAIVVTAQSGAISHTTTVSVTVQ